MPIMYLYINPKRGFWKILNFEHACHFCSMQAVQKQWSFFRLSKSWLLRTRNGSLKCHVYHITAVILIKLHRYLKKRDKQTFRNIMIFLGNCCSYAFIAFWAVKLFQCGVFSKFFLQNRFNAFLTMWIVWKWDANSTTAIAASSATILIFEYFWRSILKKFDHFLNWHGHMLSIFCQVATNKTKRN